MQDPIVESTAGDVTEHDNEEIIRYGNNLLLFKAQRELQLYQQVVNYWSRQPYTTY